MALPSPQSVTGKGTTLKAAVEYVHSQWGADGVARLTAAMKEIHPDLLGTMIVPNKRYPLVELVAVYETIDRLFGRGDLALCWDIGRFAGEYEIKLLHKVFLKIARLEYWLKMAVITWGMYYNMGKLTPSIHDTDGDVQLREFNPISKAFCYRFGGWVGKVVELTNLRNVKVTHTHCLLDGDEACVWHGTWTR